MFYLVDASVYVFRAYYSIPDSMTDAQGNPTNALYGYGRFLAELLLRERPSHIAVAFDESLTHSYRNEIYADYKANRESAPPELKRQFEQCRELTRAFGVAEFGSSRYEADDLIGSLAAFVRGHGHPVTIVSRDKDLAQLVRDGDCYWDYAADKRIPYADIADVFGVPAERMADFLALMGDAVDNIPGVRGVGKKTAAVLLTHYESIAAIYADLDGVAQLPIRGAKSLAEKLRKQRDAADLALRLTEIKCDLPVVATPESLRRREPDMAQLDALREVAGFGEALRRMAETF